MYPDLTPREFEVPLSYINSSLGLSLDAPAVSKLLNSMQLEVTTQQQEPSSSGSSSDVVLNVRVPATRSDILHACDVMEDVAIAYGYNNLQQQIPSTVTQGRELPLNQLSELLRQEVALAGYTEVLTWALCSRGENFDNMRNPEATPGSAAVAVGNPQTAEFEVNLHAVSTQRVHPANPSTIQSCDSPKLGIRACVRTVCVVVSTPKPRCCCVTHSRTEAGRDQCKQLP